MEALDGFMANDDPNCQPRSDGRFGRSLNVSSKKHPTWHENVVKPKNGYQKFRWEVFFPEILFWVCAVPKVGLGYLFQKLGMPLAAGRWFSKWMGVAGRLSPFTKMDGTTCWGTDLIQRESTCCDRVELSCWLKILRRSWKIYEDPGKSKKILEKSWIRYCKLWRSPERVHDESLIYASSLDVTPPFDASAGSLGACIAGLGLGHGDLLDHVQDSTLR